MPELSEGRYAGEFVVSEGNGRISRETITVLSGETLEAGAVLGKLVEFLHVLEEIRDIEKRIAFQADVHEGGLEAGFAKARQGRGGIEVEVEIFGIEFCGHAFSLLARAHLKTGPARVPLC